MGVVVALGLIGVTANVLIIAGCIWAYLRFRFRSIPWILAYFVLQQILPHFTGHFINQVFDKHPNIGNEYFLWGMTWNEFTSIYVNASAVTATLATALIAWFILSELASSNRGTASQTVPAIPAIISLPVRHSYAVGTALLLCVITMPLFWLYMDLTRIK